MLFSKSSYDGLIEQEFIRCCFPFLFVCHFKLSGWLPLYTRSHTPVLGASFTSLVMHLSMLSPRKGDGYEVVILTFSFKKIQFPHPWDKIIGQNVHPAASEGCKMSFVRSKLLAWGRHRMIKISTLGTDLTIKLPWLARPPLPGP